MKTPFLIVNPKNYLNLEQATDLANYANNLAVEHDVNLLFSAPFPYLPILKEKYKNLKIVSQHVDDVTGGVGMGKVSVEALADINVDVVVLNHAENPLTYDSMIRIVDDLNNRDIDSIVCCNSVKEAKALALLNPTVILCEPTELIGTGQVSDLSYIEETNRIIRKVNPNILVEQAAGVSNGEDVYNLIMAGSDGTGATSGIVKSSDPKATLLDMVLGLKRAKNESDK